MCTFAILKSIIEIILKLGPNVVIGAGAKIGAGVRISNSIILDGAEIYVFTILI